MFEIEDASPADKIKIKHNPEAVDAFFQTLDKLDAGKKFDVPINIISRASIEQYLRKYKLENMNTEKSITIKAVKNESREITHTRVIRIK